MIILAKKSDFENNCKLLEKYLSVDINANVDYIDYFAGHCTKGEVKISLCHYFDADLIGQTLNELSDLEYSINDLEKEKKEFYSNLINIFDSYYDFENILIKYIKSKFSKEEQEYYKNKLISLEKALIDENNCGLEEVENYPTFFLTVGINITSDLIEVI